MYIIILLPIFKLNDLESVTLMYLVLGIISMAAVIRSCFPFTKLRLLICIIMIGGFSSAVLLFYETLNLAKMSVSLFLMAFGWSVLGLFIERKIHFMMKKNRRFS